MSEYDPEALTDTDSMPFGRYKEFLLSDVPEDYLVWFVNQPWAKEHPRLVEYANNIGSEGDDESDA